MSTDPAERTIGSDPRRMCEETAVVNEHQKDGQGLYLVRSMKLLRLGYATRTRARGRTRNIP